MWFNGLNDLVSKGESAKERIQSALIGQPENNSSCTEGSLPAEENKGASESFVTGSSLIGNLKHNISKPAPGGEAFSLFKNGIGSMVEATKEATKHAVETLEKEQSRIQAQLFQKGPHKRDINLPLDTEALKDAELVYITDRLITMSHPAVQSAVNGDITPNRKMAAIAHLLQKRHGGRYMIWNLSELTYDYSLFDDQCMTFEFPGQPSPPLGMFLKILLSLESWLKADDRNVAVMHCLTGRGRTSTVMAAFLCWVGEAGFDTPTKALNYLAECKKIEIETLTIPSQVRYVNYFANMLDGIRPSQPPLLLRRIIMSEAPKLEKYSSEMSDKDSDGDNCRVGCAPYVQIFKGGKLIFTAAASKSYNQSEDDLPFCLSTDGSITFPIETVVHGDILIRCRHLTRKGQRLSMFRAAMHTGYIPPKVLRLRKSEIDGACNDKRYPEDFFIDLVFDECSADVAGKLLVTTSSDNKGIDGSKHSNNIEESKNEASSRRMMGTFVSSDGAVTLTASAYDSMLHRDSRFWDVIAKRRSDKSKLSSSQGKIEENVASFYGPLIGRRREFAHERVSMDHQDTKSMNQATMRSGIDSFTIGEELDFTTEKDSHILENVRDEGHRIGEPIVKKEKDDLMEALMALDDDDDDDEAEQDGDFEEQNQLQINLHDPSGYREAEVEEIVFAEDLNPKVGALDVDEKKLASKEEETKLADNLQLREKVEQNEDDYDGDEIDDLELQDLEDFLTKINIF